MGKHEDEPDWGALARDHKKAFDRHIRSGGPGGTSLLHFEPSISGLFLVARGMAREQDKFAEIAAAYLKLSPLDQCEFWMKYAALASNPDRPTRADEPFEIFVGKPAHRPKGTRTPNRAIPMEVRQAIAKEALALKQQEGCTLRAAVREKLLQRLERNKGGGPKTPYNSADNSRKLSFRFMLAGGGSTRRSSALEPAIRDILAAIKEMSAPPPAPQRTARPYRQAAVGVPMPETAFRRALRERGKK